MGLSEQAERRDASTYPIRGMKANPSQPPLIRGGIIKVLRLRTWPT